MKLPLLARVACPLLPPPLPYTWNYFSTLLTNLNSINTSEPQHSFSQLLILSVICVCLQISMWVYGHQHTTEWTWSHRKTYWSWYSPSIMEVLMIKLRPSGLEVGVPLIISAQNLKLFNKYWNRQDTLE